MDHRCCVCDILYKPVRLAIYVVARIPIIVQVAIYAASAPLCVEPEIVGGA